MLGVSKVTETVANSLFSISTNPVIIMLLINVFLLFLGTFMETNASLLIMVPILMPIIAKVGLHPVQFGVVMVLNLMIGLLTPPMALCLFITSRIGNISFERAFKAVVPYYFALLAVLFLINVFPPLTLTIPQMVFGESF
jgi:TRAP-type C4-dicarboxylate transport system permease large subunit